ncbi:acyl-CoA-binding domain-containing protein 4 [Hippoglossus stenolepis]|uniref:acyl-CoA-binding domain-containing protein 4 n=1 Tax=Hippoglossus stenolepis TaxID=195615 RepID=UPI001FB02AFA|nr:acyl-CoA-binding domain-containing protein 4 [Hippoglossus stenolepis]
MAKMNFYVLWSLRDAPRQFISKSTRRCFQVHVPLPLPKQLVIFGLGEWRGGDTATISVEVVVSAELQAQRIGTLTSQARCLTWEGDWSPDIVSVAAERGRRGVYGKIVLTVCGEGKSSVLSSTPLAQRKCLFPEQHNATDLCSTLHHAAENETITPNSSQLSDSVSFAEIQVNKIDTSAITVGNKPTAWPTEKTPRRTVISKRGHMTWSSEDMDSLTEDIEQASTPKKKRLYRMNSQEGMTAQIKSDNRRVSVCPSKRWSHTMCLSDPDTAILIGGETADQNYCKDSLWKLELDSDFWFPMNSSASGPVPLCARGHSATYDPDSKSVFVYGGLREGQRYSELYILNTLTWKWKLVTAKGNIPTLAYHSALFYKKELFVFGGVHPGHSSGEKSCSNALYIFNPEFELWYQPIVEGDKPLPRFGHSATLLSQRLMIFGGRKTATYLNDLHVLDLGFMEYTAVKCGNMPPLPRGFHAAVPVSDNRILISGGCSAIGALQDVHVFSTDTNMWSSVASPVLCSKPRAGHSMLSLSCSVLTDTEKHEQSENVRVYCTVLVFGGSDCSGTFYNDTLKYTVEVPGGK